MKRKNNYQFRPSKKRQGKTSTIILVISGIFMTGLVTWVALNDWDVEKSLNRVSSIIKQEEKKDEVKVEVKQEAEEQPKSAGILEIPKETADLLPAGEDEIESGNADKSIMKAPEVEKSTSRLDNGGYIEGQKLPSKPTYVNEILIANKNYPLPTTFAPGENDEARVAFDKMAAKAALAGFNLTAFSTYRSFDYQVELYERYVNKDGKEAADQYSARPGYSEHQTGLAFDIGEVNFEKHWASSSFGDTEAGKWVAAEAHRFGFILRYPVGKEEVTGYMHESWHFRYVGPDIATEIAKKKITLEEYLGI